MTFVSPIPSRRRGPAKSCGVCYATSLRARRLSVTQRRLRITRCSQNCVRTRSRIRMTGMTEKRGKGFSMRIAFRALIAAIWLCAAVATASKPARVGAHQDDKKGSSLTAAEQEVVSLVSANTIRDVTVKLSSPEMEGRGTAQPGAERSAKYIAERFKQVGLK